MLERPMDYCDRRCELCPQRPGCPIYEISAGRRSLSDIEVLRRVAEDLERTNELLVQDLKAMDVDAAELSEAPIPPEAESLRELGMQYAIAMRELVERAELEPDVADELIHFGFQIGAKCASLAGEMQLGFDEDMADIWGSSLLIVELAAVRIDAALNALRRTDLILELDPIHRALNVRLAPLLARVPEDLRTLLRERIDTGIAPSPFLLRDEPWPDSLDD